MVGGGFKAYANDINSKILLAFVLLKSCFLRNMYVHNTLSSTCNIVGIDIKTTYFC